jgi:opacity protein-like surface antigen
LASAIFATLVFTSMTLAQEQTKHEVSIQGTGFFTNDTTGKGIRQHTTNSGGLLISHRYQINNWLATDGSYGYSRNTYQNAVTDGLDVQSNNNQFTGALVLTPVRLSKFKPFVLAGGGILNFDPVINHTTLGDLNIRLRSQSNGVFVYGAGTDFNLTERIAFRLEYRGLVYDRPDFGRANLDSGRTTHTAQPSAGIVFRF